MRYQWLKDFHDNQNQIDYLEWNLNRSKLELERWKSGDLAKVKLAKGSRACRLEENIEAIENELSILREQQIKAKELISSFDDVDSSILRLKYVENLSLAQISEKLGYSDSYIRIRHASLKKTLDFLDDYSKKIG